MKKMIIFDIDGTLFDTKEGIIKTFNKVLGLVGTKTIEVNDEAKYIGPPVKSSFIKYAELSEAVANEATALYRKYYVEEYVGFSRLYDGVETCLNELLDKGYILGIATMKTYPQVKKLLDITIESKYFSVIKTAKEDGSLSKSQMLKEIKTEFGEGMYYMVGDTEGDYKASCDAGMNFIYASYGYGELLLNNDTYILKKFSDLLDIFN